MRYLHIYLMPDYPHCMWFYILLFRLPFLGYITNIFLTWLISPKCPPRRNVLRWWVQTQCGWIFVVDVTRALWNSPHSAFFEGCGEFTRGGFPRKSEKRRVPPRRVPPRQIPPNFRKAADSPGSQKSGGFALGGFPWRISTDCRKSGGPLISPFSFPLHND